MRGHYGIDVMRVIIVFAYKGLKQVLYLLKLTCAFYRSFELCMCMIKYLLCRFLPVQVTTLASWTCEKITGLGLVCNHTPMNKHVEVLASLWEGEKRPGIDCLRKRRIFCLFSGYFLV